ncbi:collagen, type I, alpha 1a-like [Cavia porcellus]|uniref:collagen, type I, alpha 1a-like n=1 Tax=Cavia porcellus TaxID=10141 RepID=UPI002FE27433
MRTPPRVGANAPAGHPLTPGSPRGARDAFLPPGTNASGRPGSNRGEKSSLKRGKQRGPGRGRDPRLRPAPPRATPPPLSPVRFGTASGARAERGGHGGRRATLVFPASPEQRPAPPSGTPRAALGPATRSARAQPTLTPYGGGAAAGPGRRAGSPGTRAAAADAGAARARWPSGGSRARSGTRPRSARPEPLRAQAASPACGSERPHRLHRWVEIAARVPTGPERACRRARAGDAHGAVAGPARGRPGAGGEAGARGCGAGSACESSGSGPAQAAGIRLGRGDAGRCRSARLRQHEPGCALSGICGLCPSLGDFSPGSQTGVLRAWSDLLVYRPRTPTPTCLRTGIKRQDDLFQRLSNVPWH